MAETKQKIKEKNERKYMVCIYIYISWREREK